MNEIVRKACKQVAKADLTFVVKRGAPKATAFGDLRTTTQVQKNILNDSQRNLDLLHEANLARCQERVDHYKALKEG